MFSQLGYGPISVDGQFGGQTWRANYKYETKHRWIHDGAAGSTTFRQMVKEWDSKKNQKALK